MTGSGAGPRAARPLEIDLLGYGVRLDVSLVAESRPEVRRQLREYASWTREAFDLEVAFPGSFSGTVLERVGRIPYGETRTYGELAAELGTSPVAVGGACGRNPVPLVVPCHRVVGADSLGGFSSEGGVGAKRALLAHERAPGLVQAELGAFR